MLNPAAAFADMAVTIAAAFGVPFYDGVVVDQSSVVYDDGGSIVSSGTPAERACRVQIDSATEAMRSADGYADGDVRFIILSATLSGTMGTDATVKIVTGDRAGVWQVSSIERDPAGIGFVGRGRKV